MPKAIITIEDNETGLPSVSVKFLGGEIDLFGPQTKAQLLALGVIDYLKKEVGSAVPTQPAVTNGVLKEDSTHGRT